MRGFPGGIAVAMKSVIAASAMGLTLLVCCPVVPAAAQTAASVQGEQRSQGMLTAQAFKETPESFTVSVSPYDDSGLNLRLKDDFEAQLRDSGRGRVATSDEAGYLLLFESGVVPAEAVPRGPSLGSAQVGNEGVDVTVNIWSSSQDSVLGGRQDKGLVGSSVFHIGVILRDRESGTVVWQGDAYHELDEPETERVARAMVAPLVEKIGQSVAREPFEIE